MGLDSIEAADNGTQAAFRAPAGLCLLEWKARGRVRARYSYLDPVFGALGKQKNPQPAQKMTPTPPGMPSLKILKNPVHPAKLRYKFLGGLNFFQNRVTPLLQELHQGLFLLE